MTDQYNNKMLRVAVAQICQTIGYNGTQTAPLELLQDILHKFLTEFARDLRRQTEHYNRIDANLNDTFLTLNCLNINIEGLLDYINNVEPVPFAVDIPKPTRKPSNLNFLKRGSKEVLSRPVHIFEYLPPLLPPETPSINYIGNNDGGFAPESNCEVSGSNGLELDQQKNTSANSECREVKPETQATCNDTQFLHKGHTKLGQHGLDEEGRPAREISSVVMTTGGFISPAIEGKLADAIIPDIIGKLEGLDALPPTPPPPKTDSLHALYDQHNSDLIKSNTAGQTEIFPILLPTGEMALSMPKTEASSSNTTETNMLIETTVAKLVSTKGQIINNTATKPRKRIKKKVVGPQFFVDESQTLDKASEKAQRKRMKMFQKLSKCAKQSGNNVFELTNCDKKFRTHLNPDVLTTLPPGPERQQMEKLLKKQAKQRQKILKHQQLLCGQFEMQQEQLAEFNSPSDLQMMNKNMKTQQEEQGGMAATNTNIDNLFSSKTIFPPLELHQLELATITTNDKVSSDYSGVFETKSNNQIDQIDQKLSNEPDRNKLNIFKKISKQKSSKSAAALSPKSAITLKSTSDISANTSIRQPMFNLPTGTTITPTLTIDSTNTTKIIDAENVDMKSINPVSLSLSALPNFYAPTVATTAPPPAMDINKPKKRGRKPGSKNQVKTNASLIMQTNNQLLKQTTKHMKFDKFDYATQQNPLNPAEFALEPLNLTHANQYEQIFPTYIPNFTPTTTTTTSLPKLPKERKERKKHKAKQKTTIGDNILVGLASNEDVNTINKKLLLMDTVLKPAPPLAALMISDIQQQQQTLQDIQYNNSKAITSPGKSANTKFLNTAKKRTLYNANIQAMATPQFNTQSFLASAGSGGGGIPNFANLQANMLSMLPLLPFQTQPGLIPTQGLFSSTGLSNYSNNPAHSNSTNMLLPNFLPFPKPYTATAGKLITQDVNVDSFAMSEMQAERSYCNVAPLVPETMKLIASEKQSTARPSTAITPVNNDIPVTPRGVRQLLTPSDTTTNDAFTKTLNDLNIPGSVSNCSTGNKQLLNSTGVITTTNFEKFVNKKPSSAAAGNEDDPIEVSDDSDEVVNIADNNCKSNIMKPSTLLQTNVTATQMDDIFFPSNNNFSSSDATNSEQISITKKIKKSLKMTKKNMFVNSSIACANNNFNLDFIGNEKMNSSSGVGRLAGGADLIPLTGPESGLAYSSKTIPSTSLTATALPHNPHTTLQTAVNAAPLNNVYGSGATNIFDTLTITPTVTTMDDMKKRKEYKKLKKQLKDGKIKKKKDKKDKIKNKDRLEKYTFKCEKPVKEKDKKLKKEKKKEKQRQMLEADSGNLSINTTFNVNPVLISTDALQMKDMLISAIPTNFTSIDIAHLSAAPATTAAATVPHAHVPKITLKLGSGSSKSSTPIHFDEPPNAKMSSPALPNANFTAAQLNVENNDESMTRVQSPELARFSPLVTRPPKQKISTAENASYIVSANAVGGTSSHVNQSELTTSTSNLPISSANQTLPSTPAAPGHWLIGGTLSASSVLLPQQLLQTATQNAAQAMTTQTTNITSLTATTTDASMVAGNEALPQLPEKNRPSSYIDAEGNRVWICPACGKVDDGSAMIGCDGCDAWYHWVCVGIVVAPKDNEDWFCRVCITRKKVQGSEKKRKRNKKK